MSKELVPLEIIENKIYLIRGQKVMLDKDLAELYRVENRTLKQQVKRNIDRFPPDFMFILTKEETAKLVSHFVIPSASYFGGAAPFAFTEEGIAMLSSVLRGPRAVQVNIAIMRAFVRLRQVLANHKDLAAKIDLLEKRAFKHDSDIRELVRDIRKLTIEKTGKKLNVGFKA